jgi:uncharacterized protein
MRRMGDELESIWDKYVVLRPDTAMGDFVLLDPVELDSYFLSANEYATMATESPVLPTQPAYASYRQALVDRLERLGESGVPSRIGGYRIVITDKCNMACSYCFVNTNTGSADMSEEDLRAGLDYLFQENAGETDVYLQWFGGEPTVRFDLMQSGDEYARDLADRHGVGRIYHTVVTNGVLLTDEMIVHYKRFNYGVGISLDGKIDVNLRERKLLSGQSADPRIVANARRLIDSGVHVGCNLTPTEHNVSQLQETIAYLFEVGFRFVYVNTPIPARGKWGVSGGLLANQLYRARMQAYGKGGMLFSAIDRIYQALDNRQPKIYEHLQGDRRSNVALLPERRISICDLNWKNPEFVYNLEELRKDPTILGRVRKSLAPAAKCDRCPAVAICGGPSQNDVFLVGSEEPDREMCDFYTTGLLLALRDDVGLQ